jgi:hypothetical protein
MKRVLFALALLGMAVGGANADPTNLDGGALITHYDPVYIWSEDPCADFYLAPLTVCDDQGIEIQTSTYMEVTWYVVADFAEEKEWCGVQFGLSDYDPGIMYFLNWMACYPPDGGLEIASPGWPGPLQGSAIVSTGAPWLGDMVPVYAFNAYAYGYGAPGVVQLIPDPTVAIPFGGMGNCASPPEKWESALGGMGVNMPGTWVCWTPVQDDYVCCVGELCYIVHSEDECTAMGGVFHPEWNTCEPNPCLIIAACCLEGICTLTDRLGCEAIGGEFHPEWLECDPNPCPPFGACCDHCDCMLMYQEECEEAGYLFIGGPCDPNPCPGTPSDVTSWGSIKSLYR